MPLERQPFRALLRKVQIRHTSFTIQSAALIVLLSLNDYVSEMCGISALRWSENYMLFVTVVYRCFWER